MNSEMRDYTVRASSKKEPTAVDILEPYHRRGMTKKLLQAHPIAICESFRISAIQRVCRPSGLPAADNRQAVAAVFSHPDPSPGLAKMRASIGVGLG